MIQVTFVAVPLTAMLMVLATTFMMLPTLLMSDDDADDGVTAMLMTTWGMVGLIVALAGLNYWQFVALYPSPLQICQSHWELVVP